MTAALAMLPAMVAATSKKPTSSGSSFLFILIIIGVGFYFFFYRPQQRKAKLAREAKNTFDVGDEVLTAGGLVGHVIDIDGDRITLETSVGASFVVLRPYILRQVSPPTTDGHDDLDDDLDQHDDDDDLDQHDDEEDLDQQYDEDDLDQPYDEEDHEESAGADLPEGAALNGTGGTGGTVGPAEVEDHSDEGDGNAGEEDPVHDGDDPPRKGGVPDGPPEQEAGNAARARGRRRGRSNP
ncbi:MAG: preprotein translocase subunit YajC [Acidimicrobiales bacterium]